MDELNKSKQADSAACEGDCSTCGSNCEGGIDPDAPTVTLTMDDDTEVTCLILTIFPCRGNEYIALLPLDENGENQDGEVYLYRYIVDANGTKSLDNIMDDDEYEAAAETFDEMMDKIAFDEMHDAESLEGIVGNADE